jgi:hypothetical protein
MNSRTIQIMLPALLAMAPLMFGQNIISAKAGLIHYLEGRVLLDDQLLNTKLTTKFPEMKEKSVLRTEQGRAEILLTPGAFLRVAEDSCVRMLDVRLASTRVEVVDGSILVEVAELLNGNAISLVYKDSQIELLKKGLYRVDSTPGGLRVHDGEAWVTANGQRTVVKEGRSLTLDETATLAKFDKELGDSLHRWAGRRANYLSLASVSAAHSLYSSDSVWTAGGWRYNPYFGMFTFIPGRGVYRSPFGYSFWSPYQVYQAFYMPRPVYGGGGAGGYSGPRYDSNLGYTVNSRGGMASSAPSYSGGAAAAAPSAPAPSGGGRGGDAGVGRGSSGGGR